MDRKGIKVIGQQALQDGLRYLVDNPLFLVRAAAQAARLRLGIPLDALRWLIANLAKGPKVPKDIELRAQDPALGIGASVNMMGTPLRINANLHFSEARMDGEQLLLGLRVRDLKVQAPKESPLNQMIGAMDLSRPGNLMMFLPRRPPALVEARDDLFVLDVLRLGKLGEKQALRKGLLALGDFLGLRNAQVEGDLLVLSFRADLRSLPAAIARLRS
jgi:hypothetical protein